MNTKNTFYPDEKFDFSNTQNLSLCIEIGFRHFTACIIDENTFSISYAEKIEFEDLPTLKKESKVLTHTFKHVYVSVFNPNFTLIPKALFDEKHIPDYLKLNLGELNDQTEHHQSLSSFSCVNAYRLENSVLHFFEQLHKNVTFLHSSSVFLKLVSLNQSNNNKLFLNIYEQHFLICYFKDGKLNLINSFEFKSEEDFIYLLLFLSKELNINQEKVELKVSGNQQYTETLQEYFSSVSALESDFTKNSIIPKLNLGQFINTIYSFKCV